MSRRNRDRMAQQAAAQANTQAEATAQTDLLETKQAETEPSTVNDEGFRPEPRNEPRRLAMEEIEQRDLREKGIPVEPEAKEPEPKEASVETPVQAVETPTEQEAPAETPPEEPKVETVRVKVDGEEFDAPKAEVDEAGGIRAYQREKAAENRLRKANEALAETRRLQAQLQAAAQAQQPPAKTTDQILQEKVDIIRYGTPEESARALQEVLDIQRVDLGKIVGQAVSVMQQQMAESAFVNEFSDIVHTPLFLKLAINLKNERIAHSIQTNQPINDWNHFYRSIGNEIRGAIGRPSQAAQTPSASGKTTDSTSPATSDKEAKKASIVNLPTSAARAALPEADKPETRDDILKEMRKSRGIPTG